MANSKYFITTLLAVLIATSLANAQNSAQATMRVTVRVVGGVSATAEKPAQYTADRHHLLKDNIGSVTLTGSPHETVHISSDRTLQMINERGESFDLGISSVQAVRDDGLYYSMGAIGVKGTNTNTSRIPEGHYKGTLTTVIEYL